MRYRTVDELVAAGMLEAKPVDAHRVRRWLERSRADLDLAAQVLAPIDAERAIGVAYEAAYRACAGVLAMAGYRVTSQPGHHRATLEGAAAMLGVASQPLIRRIDSARRFRNDALYGDVQPVPEDELQQVLADAGIVIDELAARLGSS